MEVEAGFARACRTGLQLSCLPRRYASLKVDHSEQTILVLVRPCGKGKLVLLPGHPRPKGQSAASPFLVDCML